MTYINRPTYGSFLSARQDQKMENMGKRLKALRLASGLSQTEAAKALNIAQPSLSALESGASKTLGGETLARACRVFHTTAEYIWFGTEASDDPELPLVEAPRPLHHQRGRLVLPQRHRRARDGRLPLRPVGRLGARARPPRNALSKPCPTAHRLDL